MRSAPGWSESRHWTPGRVRTTPCAWSPSGSGTRKSSGARRASRTTRWPVPMMHPGCRPRASSMRSRVWAAGSALPASTTRPSRRSAPGSTRCDISPQTSPQTSAPTSPTSTRTRPDSITCSNGVLRWATSPGSTARASTRCSPGVSRRQHGSPVSKGPETGSRRWRRTSPGSPESARSPRSS